MKSFYTSFVIISLIALTSFCFGQAKESNAGPSQEKTKLQEATSTPSAKTVIKDLLLANGIAVEDLDSQEYVESIQEIRVRWDAYADRSERPLRAAEASHPSINFAVVSRQQRSSGMPRQRAPELSSDQLLIVAVDALGRLRAWALMMDPRIIRDESADTTGAITGQILYRATPEFLIPLPDNPAIKEVRFYHPRWTGSTFVLDTLGKVSL